MPENSNIERALGTVIGQLRAIEDRLKRADDSRAKTHSRLDDLVLRTTYLESDMASTKTKIEKIEAVTSDVVEMRTKAMGAGWAGKWIIRSALTLIGAAGWLYSAYLSLTGRPPP